MSNIKRNNLIIYKNIKMATWRALMSPDRDVSMDSNSKNLSYHRKT